MRRSVSTSARSALLPPLARRMCAKRNARKTKIPQSSNMAGDCKDFQRCTLDNNGCLKLSSILLAFNAAVSEEQAWAVCFQTAKCMVNEWNSDSSSCYRLSDTSHILIHKDGFIHRSTVKLCSKDAGDRKLAYSEYQLVASLGMIVFNALDFRYAQDEERNLSRPLETLIEAMTSACSYEEEEEESSQTADEGIEQDSGEDEDRDILSQQQPYHDGKAKRGMTLVRIMELCANHLTCPEQADSHYKAVCRALVAEILELTSFLENISTQVLPYSLEDETNSKTLEKLRIQDWARLWMQVIQQLRQGVKLKKIDPALIHPIEYALTPYEMLLDDIRSRRYKLRQVMVNGDIPPRVKKDAHALILEFIRSRPPLVPVSKRKLPPTPPKQLTLYEKLMASIKQQPKLKPTVTQNGDVAKRKIETSRTKLEDTDETPQPQRRLIKADINLGFCSSFEDLDDIPQTPIDDCTSLPSQNGTLPLSGLTKSISHADSLCSERRHSISVCESPPKSSDQTPQDRVIINGHFPSSTGHSSQSYRSEYWKSSQWQSLECLSLTLEEVVHIRNVLTKAELEELTVDPALCEDIRKGKVCFTCKQIRFSFFGPWGVKCKMCERTVCYKCSSKMRIPTEHFARIPVYMLSPTPSPPPEEESSHGFWKFSEVFGNSTMTDPIEVTPKLSRQKTTVENGHSKRRLNFRHSESVYAIPNNKKSHTPLVPAPTNRRRPPLQRSKTLVPSETVSNKSSPTHDKGPLAPVCRECKVMVSNIIMASQDRVSFQQRRRKNSRTWPNKISSSNSRPPWK